MKLKFDITGMTCAHYKSIDFLVRNAVTFEFYVKYRFKTSAIIPDFNANDFISGLLSNTLSYLIARYGDKVAVFHSALSLGQRLDEWKRVKNGDAHIAIGTRSAVFAPFDDVGLIIIDEEQEHTYKSEMSPRYNAKDVARYRVGCHNGLLVLSSATPSIDTYTKAKNGSYSLFKLCVPSIGFISITSLMGGSSRFPKK